MFAPANAPPPLSQQSAPAYNPGTGTGGYVNSGQPAPIVMMSQEGGSVANDGADSQMPIVDSQKTNQMLNNEMPANHAASRVE